MIPIKNRLISRQKLIFRFNRKFSIIYDRSSYFLMIDFRIFLQVFTIHVRINLKIWTAQSKPWDLSVYEWAYGILMPWSRMKSINKRSIIDQWVYRSFFGWFFDQFSFFMVNFWFKLIIKIEWSEPLRYPKKQRESVCSFNCFVQIFIF